MKDSSPSTGMAAMAAGLFLTALSVLGGTTVVLWTRWSLENARMVAVGAPEAPGGVAGVARRLGELPGVREAQALSRDRGLEELGRAPGRQWIGALVENPLPDLVSLRVSWEACWTGALPGLVERAAAVPGVARMEAFPDALVRAGRFGGWLLLLFIFMGGLSCAQLVGIAGWRASERAQRLRPLMADLKKTGGTLAQAVALSNRHQRAEALGSLGIAGAGCAALEGLVRFLALPWFMPTPLGFLGRWALLGLLGLAASRLQWGRAVRRVWMTAAVLLAVAARTAVGAEDPAAPRPAGLEEQHQRLEALKEKLREHRRKQDQATRKERSLLAELEEMGQKLERKKADIRRVQRGMATLSRQIQRTRRELTVLMTEQKITNGRLGQLASDAYLLEQAPVAALAGFDARLAGDVEPRRVWLGSLGTHEGETQLKLESSSAAVTAKKRELEEARAREAALRRREQSRYVEIVHARQGRSAWLEEVRHEQGLIKSALAELGEASRQLEQLIAFLQREARDVAPRRTGEADLATLRGRLPWPVKGTVITRFGVHPHPLFRTKVNHQGITIRTEEGLPVLGVASGTVVYSDDLKGYGRLVVVQHEGEMYTLYGQLASSGVSVGDAVDEGQVLGHAGPGEQEGEGLMYFEIRKGKQALDPSDWLRKK